MSRQVPLIGEQLTGNVHELRQSSIIGLIVGLAVLLWGSTRLAQAGIFTMEQVWNLPGPARPGYVPRLVRGGVFLGVLGLGVIVTTALAGLDAFGRHSLPFILAAEILAMAANAGMYMVGFRVLTPAGVSRRRLLIPGAVAGGVAWTLLQAARRPTWSGTRCTAPPPTACSPPCSGCWPGSTSASRSPCTRPRSTWCWPGGCGRGPWSSRR